MAPFLNNDLSDGILIANSVGGCEIKPKTRCNGADLSEANLKKANLKNAILMGAIIDPEGLKKAILQ